MDYSQEDRRDERGEDFTTLQDIAGVFAEEEDDAVPLVPSSKKLDGFIGTSAVMQRLYKQIEQAACSQACVFITGESGTGKEVCAAAVHKQSVRAAKAFVPINCAAIPRDLIESELFGHVKGAFTGAVSHRLGAVQQADGGTLFLDEIGEMPLDMQTKLLRFLQDFSFTKVGGNKREYTNIRVICATNRDPLQEIHAGKFRKDLFYRLHVLPLHMPPLHARGEDVIDMARIFLYNYAEEEGKAFTDFTDEAEDILRGYFWPGNVRQLQNVVRNIVVMNGGGLVTARMIPRHLLHDDGMTAGAETAVGPGEHKTLAQVEQAAIEQAIAACQGNISQAAAQLGISPSTIYRKKMDAGV